MLVLLLAYFAGTDALYLARLGAYAALAEIDALPQPEPLPAPAPQPRTPYEPPADRPDIQPA
jgi:hypothetical protein